MTPGGKPGEGNQKRESPGENWRGGLARMTPSLWSRLKYLSSISISRNCVQTLMMLTLMISWHFRLVSLWGWVKCVRQYLDGLLWNLVQTFTFYLFRFSSGSIIKSSFCLSSTVINNQIPSNLVSCDWKVKLMQKFLNPAWPSGGDTTGFKIKTDCM